MTWRLDQILQAILSSFGPVWLVVAVAVLITVMFARIVTALLVTMLVLVCTQTWWVPLNSTATWMRWCVLLVLFARAVVFVARAGPGSRDGSLARGLMFVLGLLAILSSTWSETPEYSFKLSLSFAIGLAVTFGLLWRAMDEPTVIPTLARGALWFGLIAFAAGFVVAAVGWLAKDWVLYNAAALGTGGRYRGVFYNPNATGLLAAMILPVAVAAPRDFLGRSALFRVLVIVLAAATIFLSGSRSALIGSVLALCLLGLYRYRAGAVVTIGLGAVAILAIVLYAPLDDIDATAVGHISRTKNLSTLSGRLDLWEDGWDAARGHLVFGQGWGKSRALGNADLEQAVELGHVVGATNLHNAHLQLLIDVGFLGLALFWSFCLFVMYGGWFILRAPRNPRNALALVIFASALVLLADTWVHGSIWSMGSPTTIGFWGLCIASLKEGFRVRREVALAWNAEPSRVPPAALQPATA